MDGRVVGLVGALVPPVEPELAVVDAVATVDVGVAFADVGDVLAGGWAVDSSESDADVVSSLGSVGAPSAPSPVGADV